MRMASSGSSSVKSRAPRPASPIPFVIMSGRIIARYLDDVQRDTARPVVLGGFVLDQLGHIPREGETLTYNGYRISISGVRGVKIESVVITRLSEEGA